MTHGRFLCLLPFSSYLLHLSGSKKTNRIDFSFAKNVASNLWDDYPELKLLAQCLSRV